MFEKIFHIKAQAKRPYFTLNETKTAAYREIYTIHLTIWKIVSSKWYFSFLNFDKLIEWA